MRQTIYQTALGGILVAGAPQLSVAAPALSSTVALKSAAAPIATDVRCELTGWDWSEPAWPARYDRASSLSAATTTVSPTAIAVTPHITA